MGFVSTTFLVASPALCPPSYRAHCQNGDNRRAAHDLTLRCDWLKDNDDDDDDDDDDDCIPLVTMKALHQHSLEHGINITGHKMIRQCNTLIWIHVINAGCRELYAN